jgi:hypothetical protein
LGDCVLSETLGDSIMETISIPWGVSTYQILSAGDIYVNGLNYRQTGLYAKNRVDLPHTDRNDPKLP